MMFREMRKLYKQGYKYIVGVDEAGRGPLAGPVVAAAVCFLVSLRGAQATKQSRGKSIRSPRSAPYGAELAMTFGKIRDSKKLSAKQRERWHRILTNHEDINYGIGIVSEKVIDKINILEATKLAMVKAVRNLEKKTGKPADFLIIDGNFIISRIDSRPRYPRVSRTGIGWVGGVSQKAIPKADEKIFLCAAASIIAKVTRDRMMIKLHKKYPQYGFEKHKGYGTKKHLRALRKHGPCKIHRTTFNPIATFLTAKKLRKKLPHGKEN